MSETINRLFTEIFRPKTIEQMILVPRIRNEVSKGLVCNYLFYSNIPGTGKCLDYNEEIDIYVDKEAFKKLGLK